MADGGHADRATGATLKLGQLYYQRGQFLQARVAFEAAIASGNPEIAPVAMIGRGMLLEREGDLAGARAAFQRAVDTGNQEQARQAAGLLAKLPADNPDRSDLYPGTERSWFTPS